MTRKQRRSTIRVLIIAAVVGLFWCWLAGYAANHRIDGRRVRHGVGRGAGEWNLGDETP